MKNALIALTLFSIFSSASAQNNKCKLSASDLIRMVKADSKTVDIVALHHCFVTTWAAANHALTKYRRDYKENDKPQHDEILTVATGMVTLTTSSEAYYNAMMSELKAKGFKYTGKDAVGARYKYNKHTLCTTSHPGPDGGTTYVIIADME